MATTEQITELRVMINEPTTTTYTDQVLSDRIDVASGSLETVAGSIWREKAGSYSLLVDVQEGSSKRSLGSLSGNALKMASYYEGLVTTTTETAARVSRTRQITRP